MGTRRNFSAEFKAKIALEALVGDKTLHDRTMEATRQGESLNCPQVLRRLGCVSKATMAWVSC